MSNSTSSDSISNVQSEGTFWRSVAYAAPMLGISLLLAPISVLPGIYSKHFGLTLTSISLALLLSRLFDAVSDPIIGYYSDRIRVRTGSRKIFIFLGAVFFLLCSYFLFVPPLDVSAGYFTFWLVAYYLAFSVFAIPHVAWANEFSASSGEKTQVFSFSTMVGKCGPVLFLLLPLSPLMSSSEITPEVLRVSAIVAAVLVIVGVYIALRFVPDGVVFKEEINQGPEDKNHSLWDSFSAFYSVFLVNRPFLILISAFACFGLAYFLWVGLFFIYVDTYLGMGEAYVKVALIGTLCGFIFIPVWYRLSLWWGKKNTWILATLLLLAAYCLTGYLKPGGTHFNQLLVLYASVQMAISCVLIMVLSILGDVIDYGTLKEGVEKNGLYFSIKAFLFKTISAIGMALGFAIVGWFGFDAAVAEQAERSVMGLHLAMSWLPMLVTLLSLVFIILIPIDERCHEIIRRRLDARARRLNQTSTRKLKSRNTDVEQPKKKVSLC